MTIEEAAESIGCTVVYDDRHGSRQIGVITGTSSIYVFVQYADQRGSKATPPEYLTLTAVTA